MRIVVDASVVVATLVSEDYPGAWARTLTMGEELLAPDLLPFEVSQVLRKLELFKEISAAQASDAFQNLTDFEVELLPFADLAVPIWNLRQNFTCYDASYIAVAKLANAPLATLDLKMASQPADCQFLTPP